MTLPASSRRAAPTALDRGFQLAYVAAYRLMRAYWGVRHPTVHGTLVVLWSEGELLLVRNSYVPYYSLPGGYVRKGESASEAVVRELREEVGVTARTSDLALALEETHEWEGKRDHVKIFALELTERPRVAVDHREVVEAGWWTPEGALALNLFPPIRKVLEARIADAG